MVSFAVATRRTRRIWSPHSILAGTLYLLLAVGFLSVAARYARYEVAADGKGAGLSIKQLQYFYFCLPSMMTWGTTLAAFAGILAYSVPVARNRAGTFWACWAVGYTAFKALMPTTYETRHFFGILPALAGLATCLFPDQQAGRVTARIAAISMIVLAIALNLWQVSGIPDGLVGYRQIGRSLAMLTKEGNIFLACPHDQDLIFHYRSEAPESQRLLIRSDRTLAIRLPSYAAVEPAKFASSSEDVLKTLVKSRSRYIVTAIPETSAAEDFEENRLALRTLLESPNDFRLLDSYPLFVEFERPGRRWKVHLWEYLGKFPDGPADFSVVIPTSNQVLHTE